MRFRWIKAWPSRRGGYERVVGKLAVYADDNRCPTGMAGSARRYFTVSLRPLNVSTRTLARQPHGLTGGLPYRRKHDHADASSALNCALRTLEPQLVCLWSVKKLLGASQMLPGSRHPPRFEVITPENRCFRVCS